MNRFIILAIIASSLSLAACRSDADRMAQFCLDFERAVDLSNGDCSIMAQEIYKQIDSHSTKLRQTDVCLKTTACRPCRNAVRTMLAQCGYDDDFKPVIEQFQISDTLRRSLERPDDFLD